MELSKRSLRIGVDVGGTNTDGVVLDPLATSSPNRGIIACRHKTPTTPNPDAGIEQVITTLLEKAHTDTSSIASVTLGTTHFINAILEKDRSRLAPVAILRLCGPFTHDIPPGLDWPEDLRRLICVHFAFMKGGLEVDGQLISELDEAELVEQASVIKSKGIKSIVINGVFSPSDFDVCQEEKARDIISNHYPEADIVISKEESDSHEAIMVVDIGGTSTDVGMLLSSGFPRQAAAFTELAGIRMNFSCPDVKSIALGGGSIVRKTAEHTVTVGPDSVGHRIHEEALIFGGKVPTATDYIVAWTGASIGNTELVAGRLEGLDDYGSVVEKKLEDIIDRMKTSADDIPVLLVGGGAIIAPNHLKGASRVIKPDYAGVANAIGAGKCLLLCSVDTVVSTAGKTIEAVVKEISPISVQRAVANGARPESISIAEQDVFPLPYIANRSRIIVKAVGELDSASLASYEVQDSNTEFIDGDANFVKDPVEDQSTQPPLVEISEYKPKIVNRKWFISQLDLEWISCGCYILGTGGGGTPYPHFVHLREMLKNGAVIRVMDAVDLDDTASVACGGYMGSPTVSMEKLSGNEMMESQTVLYDYLRIKPDAVLALEIGGGNGLQVMADGNGNQMMFLKATSEEMIERAFRAALSEMGSHVALARGPCAGAKAKAYIVENTVSLAWRIGRAVGLCRRYGRLDDVAQAIIGQVGGNDSAKVLFEGKIVGVERKLVKGHSYGEVVIEAQDIRGKGLTQYHGKMRIPFKNENIYAYVENSDESEEIKASVPDLICVLDAQNGEALGTPEYRYGLYVTVIGITASPRWTTTTKGLELGGPRAFDLDIEYKPLGVYAKPRSVIEEFQ
ncbi:hypothetical protein EWM64_g3845 [Hericium alpestre]|uniref:Uncharacterized protein n=1 Tax=Hericium alpestre TaxID=135208 RepID=A0A4Z0A1G6_9AGAM|nr:hypothetical protein EWM64_g3845 [Hericium alpestre]